MNARRMEPQKRRVMELTMYIRFARVHHLVKRRAARERDATAKDLRKLRDDCWFSYRQLADSGVRDLPGSPWAWFSCRSGVKIHA